MIPAAFKRILTAPFMMVKVRFYYGILVFLIDKYQDLN